jgi:hypothetical protein
MRLVLLPREGADQRTTKLARGGESERREKKAGQCSKAGAERAAGALWDEQRYACD